ncbi:MAG: ATPase [Candidatus Latescibacteria bacterium]|nr:ATPase [Candidatus Latescibacterota bacterium]NIO28396.1 ATPase [Candidatus Latescibacterota bacterium]NIO55945.1 ATPase [Candidatus Latescibacterota bacterium]NIT01909.1 ATPase [Candidatus Latescibacterota bacterium]
MSGEEQEKASKVPSVRKLFCGVDVGASATKLILLDSERKVRAKVVRPSGVDYAATAKECLDQAAAEVGGSRDIARTVSTGYGRRNVNFADASLTEIHCHGVGCYHHIPRPITIVDIGGQDNKVIRLDASGQRLDFKMNRKCAAGTGAFIEEMALRLGLDVGEMDPLARTTEEAVRLSSFCTVFAKTEILAHLRKGIPVAEIVRGAFMSVIQRVVEMDPLDGEVVLTGGVVEYNPTIADILSKKIGRRVEVPPHPQYTGALGAALVALRQSEKK